MEHTMFGIPVEFSLDAPKDKIILHPDVQAKIEETFYVTNTYAVMIANARD